MSGRRTGRGPKGKDRRALQSGVQTGWDGVERRSKTDRRKDERRGGSRLPDKQLSPKELARLKLRADRKNKGKAISTRKKDGKLRKEVGL